MPDSMIERVREVIRAEVYRQGEVDTAALARANLNAMRKPTEAMLDAAREKAWAAGFPIRQHEIEEIFCTMIDAALAEAA